MSTLDERISAAIDAGFTDDEIQSALKSGPAPTSHGRGDELFQPDPSPSDVISQRHLGPLLAGKRTNDDYGKAVTDPFALGDVDLSGNRPADETARRVRADQEAHGAGLDFSHFALGGLLGMGVSSGAQALGAGGRTAGGIGGAVGGAAPAALDKDSHPKDIIAAALMGGVLGAAGAPRGRRDEAKSQAGRATNAIERVGGRTSAMPGRIARGGMFDEPGYRDLPDGDPGTMQMAEEARGKIAGDLEARSAANRGALGAVETRVEGELGNRKIDVEPIRQQIAKLRETNANSPAGEPVDTGLDKRLAEIDKLLLPPEAWPGGPRTDEPGATFGQLRGLQKSLKKEANYGGESTPENRPARLVEGEFGKAAKGAHPDLPGAYEKYGSEEQRLEDAKNALYGGDGTVRDEDLMTLRNDEAARGRLARHGKEGAAAANSGLTLDQLASQSPMYRQQLDRIGARNAADVLALRLSMPGGSGIAQGVARTIGHNLGAAGERFVRPATGVGYHGAGPGAAQLQLDPIIQLLLEREHRR